MIDESTTLAEDARRLESALRKRWPRSHPDLRDLLARRPGWAELIEACLASSALDEAAIARLAREVTEQDRRLVDETLALARSASAARRSRRKTAWLLIAAGFVLCGGGFALWSSRSATPSDPSQFLGGGHGDGSVPPPAVTCSAPGSADAPQGTLDWEETRPLSEGESYEIVVRTCAQDGQPARELARDRIPFSSLQAPEDLTRWTPPAGAWEEWPDCIEWSVTLLDASHYPIASDNARVERSAR